MKGDLFKRGYIVLFYFYEFLEQVNLICDEIVGKGGFFQECEGGIDWEGV